MSIQLYKPDESKINSIDWLNEATLAYCDGNFNRAQVASIMYHADAVEALRLLLMEGDPNFGEIGPIEGPKGG